MARENMRSPKRAREADAVDECPKKKWCRQYSEETNNKATVVGNEGPIQDSAGRPNANRNDGLMLDLLHGPNAVRSSRPQENDPFRPYADRNGRSTGLQVHHEPMIRPSSTSPHSHATKNGKPNTDQIVCSPFVSPPSNGNEARNDTPNQPVNGTQYYFSPYNKILDSGIALTSNIPGTRHDSIHQPSNGHGVRARSRSPLNRQTSPVGYINNGSFSQPSNGRQFLPVVWALSAPISPSHNQVLVTNASPNQHSNGREFCPMSPFTAMRTLPTNNDDVHPLDLRKQPSDQQCVPGHVNNGYSSSTYRDVEQLYHQPWNSPVPNPSPASSHTSTRNGSHNQEDQSTSIPLPSPSNCNTSRNAGPINEPQSGCNPSPEPSSGNPSTPVSNEPLSCSPSPAPSKGNSSTTVSIEPLSGSSSPTPSKVSDSSEIPPEQRCKVCKVDKASGQHYNTQSCEGCKGFFRREVQKEKEREAFLEDGGDLNSPEAKKFKDPPKCKNEGSGQRCDVFTKSSRGNCQKCRLDACLNAGMSRDLVLGEKERKALNEKKRMNKQRKQEYSWRKEQEELKKTFSVSNLPDFDKDLVHHAKEAFAELYNKKDFRMERIRASEFKSLCAANPYKAMEGELRTCAKCCLRFYDRFLSKIVLESGEGNHDRIRDSDFYHLLENNVVRVVMTMVAKTYCPKDDLLSLGSVQVTVKEGKKLPDPLADLYEVFSQSTRFLTYTADIDEDQFYLLVVLKLLCTVFFKSDTGTPTNESRKETAGSSSSNGKKANKSNEEASACSPSSPGLSPGAVGVIERLQERIVNCLTLLHHPRKARGGNNVCLDALLALSGEIVLNARLRSSMSSIILRDANSLESLHEQLRERNDDRATTSSSSEIFTIPPP